VLPRLWLRRSPRRRKKGEESDDDWSSQRALLLITDHIQHFRAAPVLITSSIPSHDDVQKIALASLVQKTGLAEDVCRELLFAAFEREEEEERPCKRQRKDYFEMQQEYRKRALEPCLQAAHSIAVGTKEAVTPTNILAASLYTRCREMRCYEVSDHVKRLFYRGAADAEGLCWSREICLAYLVNMKLSHNDYEKTRHAMMTFNGGWAR
jgi:response regulator RpfG family c-di-GMP phosphodiesterase